MSPGCCNDRSAPTSNVLFGPCWLLLYMTSERQISKQGFQASETTSVSIQHKVVLKVFTKRLEWVSLEHLSIFPAITGCFFAALLWWHGDRSELLPSRQVGPVGLILVCVVGKEALM